MEAFNVKLVGVVEKYRVDCLKDVAPCADALLLRSPISLVSSISLGDFYRFHIASCADALNCTDFSERVTIR